jgi:hypothetical protein
VNARQMSTGGAALAGAALVLAGLSASARGQTDKGKPLEGLWAQQGGNLKIEF